MEGVAITETYLQLRGTRCDFLRTPDILGLPSSGTTTKRTTLPWRSSPCRTAPSSLTNANRGPSFVSFLGRPGPCSSPPQPRRLFCLAKKAVLPNPSSRTPGGAFQTSLSSYLREGWAEDLYALKTPIWGSPPRPAWPFWRNCTSPRQWAPTRSPCRRNALLWDHPPVPGSLSPRRPSLCHGIPSLLRHRLQALVGNGDRFFVGAAPGRVGHPCPGHRGKTPWDTTSHRLSARLAAGPGGVAPGKPAVPNHTAGVRACPVVPCP